MIIVVHLCSYERVLDPLCLWGDRLKASQPCA